MMAWACLPEHWGVRAHIECGQLPTIATPDDFQRAGMQVDPEQPWTVWHLEAVRFKLHNPGKPLDTEAVQSATLATIETLKRRADRLSPKPKRATISTRR